MNHPAVEEAHETLGVPTTTGANDLLELVEPEVPEPPGREEALVAAHDVNPEEFCEYEEVRRLRRVRGLRIQWLDVLLAEQGGRCANSVVMCAAVEGGAATSVCPWGERPVPRDAADLEHKMPLSQGGTNDKGNLQMLCKCCHGIKTAAERSSLPGETAAERPFKRLKF